MDALIENAVVITCDAEGTVIEDGAVAVRGKRILEVGESGEMRRKYESLDRIDASGRAVMPGFVNAHTHSVLTVLRGTVEDMGGDAIYGYMSPISFAMTDEDRRAMNALGCLEAIRSGTTTMVDPFRHVYQYAQTMADSGLRLFLSESCADALNLKIRYGIYEYSEEWGQQFLDRTERLIEEFHGMDGGRVQCQVAAHAPDNCSPWMLRKLLDMSEKHGLRRTVHLAQSQKELDQVRSISGVSSAAYLRDNGWLGPDVLAAHWFFCDEADVEILAETGTHMAHCPAPSARTGRYPVPKMPNITDSGVNVTLGTDNMSENMFHALNIGIVLNRGLRDDNPPTPTPQTMLDWATQNGARAVGMEQEFGSIEAGKYADLTFVNMGRAHLVPAISPVSNLVHYGETADVESVMVGGEFVMRQGEVLSMNEPEVIERAREASLRVWGRFQQEYPDIHVPAYPGPDFPKAQQDG